jgi:flagellar biosynthesis protein FlhF
LDTYRIAATEPLRTYASILGVGFQPLEAGFGLRQALTEFRHKDLILIDTPGFGPRDAEASSELASLLVGHPEIEVQLILAATTQSADLTAAVDRFEIFRPAKLLFTRVDETSAFGPAFSEAARTGKPISFLATGQQVPEDLEEATKSRVVGLLLNREAVWSTAAAG